MMPHAPLVLGPVGTVPPIAEPRVIATTCEAPIAFGSARCSLPVVWVTQLAHVGAGPTTTCLTGQFTLCASHVAAIRSEVASELAAHPGARCESCNHQMLSIGDVLLEAVRIS